ncbi:hypothetical protein PVAP13_5KG192707, partial [Panicum virgatum]
FWHGLQQIREKFKWGATFTLGDGRNILFWEDVWVGDIPLKLEFPKRYEYSYNKNCLVSECWIEGEWKINFRRSFGHDELLQWEQLLHIISQKTISETSDQVKWVLEKNGNYTMRSMYRALSNRGGPLTKE